PTVFRRCSYRGKDKKPPLDLRIHSYRAHALTIVQYCTPKDVVLLGKAPLEALLRASPESFAELRSCYQSSGRLSDCRALANRLGHSLALNGLQSGLHVSYWPRGKGIDILAGDLKRILGTD